MEILLYVVVLSFIFQLIDAAAGMGFGTSMAPLLFVMGYDPLQVVPALLITQAISGIFAGMFHHEFENVNFSFKPLNEATRATILIEGIGCVSTFASILLVYYSIEVPESMIKTYVAALVLAMGFIGLLAFREVKERKYNPKRLIGFSILAGFNKGVGGGGYGPIVTLGSIFSGIYEKSAVGIVTVAEGVTSIVGSFAFILTLSIGVDIDFLLLPSIFAGSFLAAILSPYLVRILPNRTLKFIIPIYAFAIGLFTIIQIYIL